MQKRETKATRVDAYEATLIEAAARKTGQSVSEFLRDVTVPISEAIEDGDLFTPNRGDQNDAAGV